MIDIQYARCAFKRFLSQYKIGELGFNLKVSHTYHVVENAKILADKLGVSSEDKALAELIALLHDIGRFEEITFLKQFDGVKFDHASYGVKMLFEDNLIREFIEDNCYDEIIKIAINNHSRLKMEEGLDERSLLHTKIIRDADKLDNFRVKKEERIEAIFPGKVKNASDMENSLLSPLVYDSVMNEKCVNIRDRKTNLDYWVCVLAFVFDLNFKASYEIVKENDDMNGLINRFFYQDLKTKEQMEQIRIRLNTYIDKRIRSNLQ